MTPRRKPRWRWRALGCIAALLVSAGPSPAGEKVSFTRDVRPILSDHCFACHGPNEESREARLRLDRSSGKNGAYRTRGGKAAIRPGSLQKSELWRRINSGDPEERMPPPESDQKPLTAAEKRTLGSWIEAGAPYREFWSFVAPERPPIPRVKNEAWSQEPIDLFVLRQLESLGMQPSEEADKRTLIRRLTFDLTGLPPTRAEIRTFLEDDRPGAYEPLVDRLLARPGYGEHMAHYWLDLVRYADTNGMHKDFYRNLHAYRDWVIRAFNENLGYDDFLRYQLAGDLFPNPTDDQLVASGFNRLHLIIDRGTALPEESFYKNVVDRVTAVGTTFLGMTVNCATCHDHKYDPLTQRDFYSLFAFFDNIDAEPETVRAPKNGLQPPVVRLGTPEEKQAMRALEARLAELERKVRDTEAAAKNEPEPAPRKAFLESARKLGAEKKELEARRAELDRAMPRAMVMRERKEVRPTFVMLRGQYDAPGEEVTRDTPAFLPPLRKKGAVATRMDLAEWFVDRHNPLTARVAVNRFWQQLFGVGLVKTSEDLGAQGEVPSHPELLDHLAVSFMDSGWDVKALVKRIVMSRTYRQSSVATPEAFAKDPENRLLARGSRFRMDAELVRDQILATSGLLSRTMYGASVKPPQPNGLWKAVTMTGERFRADRGEAIYRRSVYTYWKRAMPPPQMTILNAPSRDACTARRERTNTPLQALLLLNESEYLKAARHLALRVLSERGIEEPQRLGLAYEIVTSKLPDERERAILSRLLQDLEHRYREKPELAADIRSGEGVAPAGGGGSAEKPAELAAWTLLVSTLYNLDITKTRQ